MLTGCRACGCAENSAERDWRHLIEKGLTTVAIRKTKIDSGWAWRWYAEPDPDSEYLAMVTIIELRSIWSLPRFEWHTRRIHGQLASTPGLLGFSFKSQFPLRYWTLSAWENGKALQRFVKGGPHEVVMTALPRSMRVFKHVSWKVAGTAVPLNWAEALQRLHRKELGPATGAGPTGDQTRNL